MATGGAGVSQAGKSSGIWWTGGEWKSQEKGVKAGIEVKRSMEINTTDAGIVTVEEKTL